MHGLINIDEYHERAKAVLPAPVYGYYSAGSDNMVTRDANRSDFEAIRLRPRVLVDMSGFSMKVTVMEHREGYKSTIDFPVMIAPTAMHCLAHADGEKATARAAARMNTVYTASELATTSLEDIAASVAQPHLRSQEPGGERGGAAALAAPMWFQMYFFKDRNFTKGIVERAQRAGYKALVVTVDAAVIGNRETDRRDALYLGEGVTLANVQGVLAQEFGDTSNVSALTQYRSVGILECPTWADVRWLRGITDMPIVLKGILAADDAEIAVSVGADGIIVSNHGGRQVDTSVSTIKALPAVVDAVRRAVRRGACCEVYVDGGISRGTDVLKCLALGAKAVLVGRAVLWGLAVGGEEGVADVLRILKDELETNMKLCGCPNVDSILHV